MAQQVTMYHSEEEQWYFLDKLLCFFFYTFLITEVLHNKKLHNLYSYPNIIREIKSRRMRWVGHVACMEEERKVYKVLAGKPKGKRLF
jgi:hypothetical protein